MEPTFHTEEPKSRFSGTTGLIVAIAVIAVVLIALPAYRWFFLISVGIGVVVAGILFLWHKWRPIREADIENKKPLGLTSSSRQFASHSSRAFGILPAAKATIVSPRVPLVCSNSASTADSRSPSAARE